MHREVTLVAERDLDPITAAPEGNTSLRVLMLEDEIGDAELMAHALRKDPLPFEILRVESEEAYLDALSSFHPDVILSDFKLPSYTGREALAAARHHSPHVPFILVTGALDDETAVDLMKAGAADYILKDRLHRLVPAVRAALEKARADEQLRRNQEMFRLISENISDCIEVLDADGHRLFVTASATHGGSLPLWGADFHQVHPLDRPYVEQALRDAIRTRAEQTAEFRMVTPEGDIRFVETRWNTVRDTLGGPSHVVVVSRDISERRAAEEARRELERAEQLLLDLQLARDVQASLVAHAPVVQGVEIFSHLESARVLGGDFYDFTPFGGAGDVLLCTIGDVVGKGASAALMMALTLAIFREACHTISSPRALLEWVNQRLRDHSGNREARNVSAAVLALDVRHHLLRYSKAGHEEPLLWRSHDGSVELLRSPGLYLGVIENVRYEECEVRLEPGDKIVLYTDGITDTRSNTGELFEVERLVELVEQHGRQSAPELGAIILQEVARFRGHQELPDDIALVILEVQAAP